jgi:hypothetical protein
VKLIQRREFQTSVLSLLSAGETSLRLKCHDLLDITCQYFCQYCASKTLYELTQATTDHDRKPAKEV